MFHSCFGLVFEPLLMCYTNLGSLSHEMNESEVKRNISHKVVQVSHQYIHVTPPTNHTGVARDACQLGEVTTELEVFPGRYFQFLIGRLTTITSHDKRTAVSEHASCNNL